MTTTIDQTRLVKGARVKAPADHPCARWGRIVHLYRQAPVARIVCDCGWRGDVPLRRLVAEPVPESAPVPARENGGYQGVRSVWTRGRIIEALRAWAEWEGRAPTQADWKRSGGADHPHAALVGQRFGSWTAAIRAAGLVPTDRRRRSDDPTRAVKRPDS